MDTNSATGSNNTHPVSDAPRTPHRTAFRHLEDPSRSQRRQNEDSLPRGIVDTSMRMHGRMWSDDSRIHELNNHGPSIVEDVTDDDNEVEPRTPRALLSLPPRFYGIRYTSFEDRPPTTMEYLFATPPLGPRGLPYSAVNAPTIAHNQIAYHAGIAKDYCFNVPFLTEADEAFTDAVFEALGRQIQIVALGFRKTDDCGENWPSCIYTILMERKAAQSCGPYVEAKARSVMFKVAKDYGLQPLKVRCVCTDVEKA